MPRYLLPLLLGLLTVSPADAARVDLVGEVTYRERIALPATAVLAIELVDLALPGRPRVSVSAPTGAGQVPLAFTLSFEDSLILPEHSYAITATITAGDIVFRNPEPYPVTPLAQVGPVTILAQRVARDEASAGAAGDSPLPPGIVGVEWTAGAIGDTPVPPGIAITLLIGEDMRAGGTGGCNSWFSQAQVTGQSFAIGEVARTLRACLSERNALEQAYFDALKAARSWAIDNDTLSLLDASGMTLLTFER